MSPAISTDATPPCPQLILPPNTPPPAPLPDVPLLAPLSALSTPRPPCRESVNRSLGLPIETVFPTDTTLRSDAPFASRRDVSFYNSKETSPKSSVLVRRRSSASVSSLEARVVERGGGGVLTGSGVGGAPASGSSFMRSLISST